MPVLPPELRTKAQPYTGKESSGGLYTEKPERIRKLFGILVWHDRALALIYGVALGGWFYIIIYSLLLIFSSLFHLSRFPLFNQYIDVDYVALIFIAALVAGIFYRQFRQMEKKDN